MPIQENFKINDLQRTAKTMCIVFGRVFMPPVWLCGHRLAYKPYTLFSPLSATLGAELTYAPLLGLRRTLK